MPLLAIISDLHQKHWARPPWTGHVQRCVRESLEERRPALVLDAGDWEIDNHSGFCAGVPVVKVHGNHDYYGTEWPGAENEARVVRVDGFPPIIVAPLWTDFKQDDPFTHVAVRHGLVDSRYIRGYDTVRILAAHREQRAFINLAAHQNPGAIVMTHHAPSYRSVHAAFRTPQDEPLNWGFVSDMDIEVEASRALLWVHGHTHMPFDYVIGETRVVCNPCGYPGENRGVYEPKYIEI